MCSGGCAALLPCSLGFLVADLDDLGEDLGSVLHVAEQAVLVVAMVDRRLPVAADLHVKAGLLQAAERRITINLVAYLLQHPRTCRSPTSGRLPVIE